MNVNLITAYNPFMTGYMQPPVSYYNPLPVNNFGYIPLTAATGGINTNPYLGTMPSFQPINFDISAFSKILADCLKTPYITPYKPTTSLTTSNNFLQLTRNTASRTTLNAPKQTSAAVINTNTITDNGKSDLKPGLFKGRLAGQEALVTRLCHKYGVSPALVASIIGLESGWGTSNLAMHNNFGGYRAAGDLGKNEKGFGYFSTIEKGLEAMIKNLADYTRYRDVSQVNFNNLDNIGRHYCEGGSWATKVREIYSSRVSNYLA